MKLQLLSQVQTFETKKKRVTPVEHFKKCPACGCKDLIDLRPDVLCSSCDWDSTAWDVSRGGMDNLIGAAKEFGFQTMEVIDGGSQTAMKSDDRSTTRNKAKGI